MAPENSAGREKASGAIMTMSAPVVIMRPMRPLRSTRVSIGDDLSHSKMID